MRTLLALGSLAFLLCGSSAIAGELVVNKTVGISVTKPDSWQHLTAEANAANLASATESNPDLQKLVARYATAPIIAFIKFAEPYPDLNPSFKINLRNSGSFEGRSGVEIATALLPALKSSFKDLTVEIPPEAATVGGLPGGYIRILYTLTAGGVNFPTISELWIVPRGKFFFMIGAGTRQDERTGSRAEIAQIVGSLKLMP